MTTLCIGPDSSDNKYTLYDRVSKLLDSFEWSDVTFIVGNKIFKAHKLILAISSPVFQVMFYGPMAERTEIVVPDVEPQVFQLLLDFIYKDKVVLDSLESACGLLYASKKYMLSCLIDMCQKYIKNSSTIANVMSVYRFSDWIQEDSLNKYSLSLICKHASVVLNKYYYHIPDACFVKILQESAMNISEKELIEVAWTWSHNECLEKGLNPTHDNKRQLLMTHNIFSHMRFLTLTKDDLDYLGGLNFITSDEINFIQNFADKETTDLEKLQITDSFTLNVNKTSRNPLDYEWVVCFRPTIRSTSPLVITNSSQKVRLRFKCDKTIFINSFLIPSCQSLDLFNKTSAPNTYTENIKLVLHGTSENDDQISMTYSKVVEYDSTVLIRFSKPYLLKGDDWYVLTISWPVTKSQIRLRYPLSYQPMTTHICETLFTFDDNFENLTNRGSFVLGLMFTK